MKSKIMSSFYAAQTPWVRFIMSVGVSLVLVVALAQTSHAALNDTQRQIIGLDKLEEQGVLQLGSRDLRETVASIINVALSLLGTIAVVVVLIGGFFWMTAGGNDDQITKAKGWIFSGIIGLAIILSAFAISKFVLEKLVEATDLGGQ